MNSPGVMAALLAGRFCSTQVLEFLVAELAPVKSSHNMAGRAAGPAHLSVSMAQNID